MFKNTSNCNKPRILKFKVKTKDPQSVMDDLYGLAWHKLNDGMNQELPPDQIAHLADFICSIDPNDEIISRYCKYENQGSNPQFKIKPPSGKKLVYV